MESGFFSPCRIRLVEKNSFSGIKEFGIIDFTQISHHISVKSVYNNSHKSIYYDKHPVILNLLIKSIALNAMDKKCL